MKRVSCSPPGCGARPGTTAKTAASRPGGRFARLTWIAGLTAVAALIAGCAGTRITSVADRTYSKSVGKLFVLADLPDKGWRRKDVREAFQSALESRFKKIGIVCQIAVRTGIELNDDEYLKAIKAFDPDALLVIDFVSGILKKNVLSEAEFNLSLVDVASQKRFWRANVGVSTEKFFIGPRPSSEEMADRLFDAMREQLKKDKLDIFAVLEPM